MSLKAVAHGVTAINGENGAVTLTSTGGTITITPSGQTINLESSGGGGSPGGASGSIQYNNAGSFGGSGTLDSSGNATFLSVTGVHNNLTTTVVNGFGLTNATASTNAVQIQNSPALTFIGHGWSSQASVDRLIQFAAYATSSTPGFGEPTGGLVITAQVGSGSPFTALTLNSSGRLDVFGILNAHSQLLISGPFTANSIGSFNGPVTFFNSANFTNGLTSNGVTVFVGDLHASDDNFYYTGANQCLSIGYEDTSATLSVSSTLAVTTPDPTSISATLQQVIGAPTSPSISQDNAGSFYTANGTTYTTIIYALDGSMGTIGNPSTTASFTDSNDGSPFQIDYNWTAPTSAPNGISQYLIGLSTDGGATYNYRLTGSSSTIFTDNDGNYPFALNSFTQNAGYTANGSTLNNTYNLYDYQTVGSVTLFSSGNINSTTTDPSDSNDYIVNLFVAANTPSWKIVRSGNLTGAYNGIGGSYEDQATDPWSDSSVVTPTSYAKPAGRFVGGGGIVSDGYSTSSGQTGISATITTARLTTLGSNGSMTFTNGLLTAQTQAT